ncbi:hypothetical protein JW933_07285, partial [candidate division FCPU426 bacterium]|nr:hypothetical protein [candidate division FCPU426 bacterium]
MTGSQIELNYRLSNAFGPNDLIRIFSLAVETIGYDEETPFDLIIQKNNDERLLLEITPLDVNTYVHTKLWASIHQIIFSNHWIKGMNVKMQLVRRPEHCSLSVKCEMEDMERRTLFINKLEEQLAKELRLSGGGATTEQERERLFGSMLMTEAVIKVTRKSFLEGDFKTGITAAVKLLQERLGVLLKKRVKDPREVLTLADEETPLLIFPDLSGKQLQHELAGLGYLCAGILTLARPDAQGKKTVPEDPARVLKLLVLVGMILERLDS